MATWRERSRGERGAAVTSCRQGVYAANRVPLPPPPPPSAFHSLDHLRSLVGSICSVAPSEPGLRALIQIFDPCTIPLSDAERCDILTSFPVTEHALAGLAHASALAGLAGRALATIASTAPAARLLWAQGAMPALLIAVHAARLMPWQWQLVPALGELARYGLPAPAAFDLLPCLVSLASEDSGPTATEALACLSLAVATLANYPSQRQRLVFGQLAHFTAYLLQTPPWSASPDTVHAATLLLADLCTMECVPTAALLASGAFAQCALLVGRCEEFAGDALYTCSALLRHGEAAIVQSFLECTALSAYVFAVVLHPDWPEEERCLALQCLRGCFPEPYWELEDAAGVSAELLRIGAVEVLLQACLHLPEEEAQTRAQTVAAARAVLCLAAPGQGGLYAPLLAAAEADPE